MPDSAHNLPTLRSPRWTGQPPGPRDLITLDPGPRDRRWWWRLRLALADLLAPPTRRHTERWAQAATVRRYQQELANRAATALTERVRAGWWLGPAPYGYQLTRAPGGRHRLAVDDHRAATIRHIFAWHTLDQLTVGQIRRRLTADPDQHLAPVDPHTGQPRPWTTKIVRGVLTNPAYLGYSVRRRRTSDGRPLPPEAWLRSDHPAHPALIDPDTFWAAYYRLHPEHRSWWRMITACNDPVSPSGSVPAETSMLGSSDPRSSTLWCGRSRIPRTCRGFAFLSTADEWQ